MYSSGLAILVEKKLHWVRDVTYGEDKFLIRTGNVPRVIASLRGFSEPPAK